MKRFLFFFLFLAIIVIGGVWHWLGDDALNKPPSSIDKLVDKAAGGDANAAFQLGEFFRKGDEVERDYRTAFKWYSKAAESRHARAHFVLGGMFEKGEGLKPNLIKAQKSYRVAARLARLPEAYFALGQLYFHGRGVAQDYTDAFSWTLKAAQRGYPPAQFLIGGMYAEGWAIKQDYIEAYKWYTLAMPERDRAMAYNPKYDPVKARKALAEKMNKFQIGRGEKMARQWRRVK